MVNTPKKKKTCLANIQNDYKVLVLDATICACVGLAVSPAAERLRYILGDDDDMPTPTLFTEMDTLQHEGDELEWKESAR